MIRVDALLLLMLQFNVLSSTKIISSFRTGVFGDTSVTHSKSLTSSGIISTVAGSHGFSEFPTVTSYFVTKGVATDVAENLFITTDGHGDGNRIFTATASTGLITVVAGTGKEGFSGDGGPAAAATFDGLSGIAVDKLGNIYVADTRNNRIRKITVSTGVITTVAGTGKNSSYTTVDNVVATSSTLSYPADVAVDAYGNIYIAGSYRVRKVTASTGIITTIAGNDDGLGYGARAFPKLGAAAGVSGFGWLTGITVDTFGNVFFSDRSFK